MIFSHCFCFLTLLEIACILTPQLVSSSFIDDFIEDVKTYRPYTRRPRPKNKPVGKRIRCVEDENGKPNKFHANNVPDVTSTELPPSVEVTIPQEKTEKPLTVNTIPQETKTEKSSANFPAKVKFNFDFLVKGTKKLSFSYEEPQIPNLERPLAAESNSK